MMKRIFYIILSFLILTCSGCAEISEPLEKKEFYSVQILETENIIASDGTVLLAVTIEWTNHSEKTISYINALECSAYQDGIELDKGYLVNDKTYLELKQNYNNRDNKVRPKIGLQITEFFIIRNTHSEIEIEIEERMFREKIYSDKFLF